MMTATGLVNIHHLMDISVTDFLFLGSKITADGDCSHEIKRLMLLGNKVVINLDTVLNCRHTTLLTEVLKAMVFPVVLSGCESWTIKKAECQRTDAFELWCWRRLFNRESWGVLWTERRSIQSILKEISPEYSLEGLTLKLKLQYSGHLMQRTESLGKTMMSGKDWRQEEKGMREDAMAGWHESSTQDMNLSKRGNSRGGRSLAGCSLGVRRVGHDLTAG